MTSEEYQKQLEEQQQQELLNNDPAYAKWSEHISKQAIKEQDDECTR